MPLSLYQHEPLVREHHKTIKGGKGETIEARTGSHYSFENMTLESVPNTTTLEALSKTLNKSIFALSWDAAAL